MFGRDPDVFGGGFKEQEDGFFNIFHRLNLGSSLAVTAFQRRTADADVTIFAFFEHDLEFHGLYLLLA